ncbi:hypothetical protein CC80DRAFT_492592 [Byssothecium circinans]|uniref:ABM domain-containing protein n=1 Tax=Byssothecium circinans TaxID=147558 RepID=A0A6A5TV94_9PLEO|nr:hypothetical protein CC80DRAFT_492592 [Byssothecium circinans]
MSSDESNTVSASTTPPVKPITEVARLRLHHGVSITDPQLRAKLRLARQMMKTYTGRSFYIMQSHHTLSAPPTDPDRDSQDNRVLYIIGEWDSIEQHMDEWIPSQDNQDLLKDLKEYLTVEWMFHIDTPHEKLPLPRTDDDMQKALTAEVVFSLERYVIKEGQREVFDSMFKMLCPLYQGYIRKANGTRLGSGWHLEKTAGKDSFCMVTAWRSTAEHVLWRDQDESLNFAAVEDSIVKNMIQTDHMKLLDI